MFCRYTFVLLTSFCFSCATAVGPGGEGDGDGDDEMPGDGDTGDGDGDVGAGGTTVTTGSGGAAAGGTTSGNSGGSTGTGATTASGGSQPDGPILFQEDFESGLDKWTLNGTWAESTDGTTVLFQERIIDSGTGIIDSDDRGYQSAFAGGPNWSEYTLTGRLKLLDSEDNSASYAGFLLCASDGGTGIVVGFKGTGEVRVRSVSSGAKLNEGSSLEDLNENELVISPGTWYGVEIQLLAGGTMQIKIDGQFYGVSVPSGYVCNPGGIGVVTERASAVFDDIYVSTE